MIYFQVLKTNREGGGWCFWWCGLLAGVQACWVVVDWRAGGEACDAVRENLACTTGRFMLHPHQSSKAVVTGAAWSGGLEIDRPGALTFVDARAVLHHHLAFSVAFAFGPILIGSVEVCALECFRWDIVASDQKQNAEQDSHGSSMTWSPRGTMST